MFIPVQLASRGTVLSPLEALSNAGTVILIVFLVLFIIFLCVSFTSYILKGFGTSKEKAEANKPVAPATIAPASQPETKEEEFSSGSLKLKNCDEKTAAMIMAIVSDNTGIPLSELVFKSIKLKEQ